MREEKGSRVHERRSQVVGKMMSHRPSGGRVRDDSGESIRMSAVVAVGAWGESLGKR